MQQLQTDSNDDIQSVTETELTLWYKWATYTAIKLKMSQTETTRSHKSIVNSICCYTANITSVSNCRWTCVMLCLSHIVLRIKVDAHSMAKLTSRPATLYDQWRSLVYHTEHRLHWQQGATIDMLWQNFRSPDFGTKFQREVARSLSSAMSSGQKPARITIHKRFPQADPDQLYIVGRFGV